MSRIGSMVIALAGAALLVAPWQPASGERLAQQKDAKKDDQKQPKEEVGNGPGGLPMTGKPNKLLAPLDEAIEKIMLRHGIPGASVAITRKGKLIYARGYGWSHHEKEALTTPQTLFGLASVSKVFTALAILVLVEEGKLKLDQKVFAILNHLKPLPRVVPDRRLSQITIRQCLNHSCGWDREKNGDPINWSQQIALAMKVRMPINEDQLIRFTMSLPLDFDPGTKHVYTNVGYVILGQIVAKISGMTYERFVRTKVLEPMGMKRASLHDRGNRYFDGEARRYTAGMLQAMPPYNAPWTDASGGWAASAVDLARMMTAIDGSRTGKPFLGKEVMKEMLAPPPKPLKPREDKTYYGLGWDAVAPGKDDYGYVKSGSWPGVRSMVKHRLDDFNTVILYNAVIQPDQLDARVAQDAIKDIQEQVAQVKEWPADDLFDRYR
jgi:N-acyl-D-amino-acid deacylase